MFCISVKSIRFEEYLCQFLSKNFNACRRYERSCNALHWESPWRVEQYFWDRLRWFFWNFFRRFWNNRYKCFVYQLKVQGLKNTSANFREKILTRLGGTSVFVTRCTGNSPHVWSNISRPERDALWEFFSMISEYII